MLACLERGMVDMLWRARLLPGKPHGAALPAYHRLAPSQIHYHNPDLLAGTRDSSGLRLFYTPRLRRHDMGNLWVGGQAGPPRPGRWSQAAQRHNGARACLKRRR
jgi:hypothetical protein